MDLVYSFWNNKGGTGKTSLAFQAICAYAEKHPDKKILVVDMCPQANLSELFLGGLNYKGSEKLLKKHGLAPRCSIGGYFQLRLPAPYAPPQFIANNFIVQPCLDNQAIPENIDLVCGDPLLELQANAINALANQNIPGTDSWIAIVDWLKDFFVQINNNYNTAFIDCNPSFSMFTQIALASSQRIILPVMADDSSRRAIQNAFSLVYGLRLPSPIYATYGFAAKLNAANRALPKVHLIAKNRITQYMGAASAYAAVLHAIEADIQNVLKSDPSIFTFKKVKDGVTDVRDFQTTGVVAFAKGQPFSKVNTGKQSINGYRVQVKKDYLDNSKQAISNLIDFL